MTRVVSLIEVAHILCRSASRPVTCLFVYFSKKFSVQSAVQSSIYYLPNKLVFRPNVNQPDRVNMFPVSHDISAP